MLRYALFAFGASFAVGLPQVAVAQTATIEPVIAQPVLAQPVLVQQTIRPVVVQQTLRPVVIEPTVQTALVTVGQRSFANERCYSPDRDGETNEAALPLCADYLQQAAGGEQYATIDRGTLANTQICASGVNCGPPADLTNVRPFYGTAGQPVPAAVIQPAPVVMTPAPVVPVPPAPVVMAPPPPVALPPAPPVFAPVAALPAAGLGGLGLAAVGVAGVAALVGVIALSNSDSTSGTN